MIRMDLFTKDIDFIKDELNAKRCCRSCLRQESYVWWVCLPTGG